MIFGIIVILLWWFLRAALKKGQTLSVTWKAIKVVISGLSSALLLGIVVGVGSIIALIILIVVGYKIYGNSYYVAFSSPSVGVPLETLREKFQGDTQATIVIADSAKKFLITGDYEGKCVRDLLQSICRQYSSRLSCKTDWRGRMVKVELINQ